MRKPNSKKQPGDAKEGFREIEKVAAAVGLATEWVCAMKETGKYGASL